MDTTTQRPIDSDSPSVGCDHIARPSQQAAVVELGQAALAQHDVNKVLDLATELLCEELDVEYAEVLHQPLPDEPLVLMAGSGWENHREVGETTLPWERDPSAGSTLLSAAPVFVEDRTGEDRFGRTQYLRDHGVVGGISTVIPGRNKPYGVLGAYTRHRRRFTAQDVHCLQSVANILGGAIENHHTRQQIEHRVHYETALAECAQALLESRGESRLEHALEALLTTTQATYMFVERNVVDPDLGFCSQTVAEVEQEGTPGYELDNEYWELVAWERMPTSQSHLEQGKPYVLIPEQLKGVEFELYTKDPFPIKSELDIPIFVDGEWVGLIGFADGTEVRQWTAADISLLTTAAKMIGAFWEREATQDRLMQMNRAKDEFLASVSHELRTPLTSVMGYAQLLRDNGNKLTAPQRQEAAESVYRQAADLNNIVGDLLVAAKADMGQLTVNRVPVNLRAQAAQVLKETGEQQASHIQLNGHPVHAMGDPARIRQILRNLINNALRYGGDTTKIEILDRDGSALVRVADNGPGVPPEDRQRIFQPHQRASTTPGLTAALGLGLTISHQLAQLMGGDLTYQHQQGESIFELSLPTSS